MTYSIHIHNHQKCVIVPPSQFKKIIQKVLKKERIVQAELSIVIVTDRKIHEINRKFLNHDFSTDVITFDLSDDELSRKKHTIIKPVEGEIYVSAGAAARKGRELKVLPEQELLLYIVHGILHLLGYDDHAATDKKRMRKKEKEILNFVQNFK
jgi:probable rRNA maturation factor